MGVLATAVLVLLALLVLAGLAALVGVAGSGGGGAGWWRCNGRWRRWVVHGVTVGSVGGGRGGWVEVGGGGGGRRWRAVGSATNFSSPTCASRDPPTSVPRLHQASSMSAFREKRLLYRWPNEVRHTPSFAE